MRMAKSAKPDSAQKLQFGNRSELADSNLVSDRDIHDVVIAAHKKALEDQNIIHNEHVAVLTGMIDSLNSYLAQKIRENYDLKEQYDRILRRVKFADLFEKRDESIKRVLDELDRFASEQPGTPVSDRLNDILDKIIKDKENFDLPTVAPALWSRDKFPDDTPPAFISRHYSKWMGNGLTRNQFRTLDMPLYTALANWLRSNDLPSGFDLPNKTESLDNDPPPTIEQVRAARRLLNRWSTREKRDTSPPER